MASSSEYYRRLAAENQQRSEQSSYEAAMYRANGDESRARRAEDRANFYAQEASRHTSEALEKDLEEMRRYEREQERERQNREKREWERREQERQRRERFERLEQERREWAATLNNSTSTYNPTSTYSAQCNYKKEFDWEAFVLIIDLLGLLVWPTLSFCFYGFYTSDKDHILIILAIVFLALTARSYTKLYSIFKGRY